MRQGRGADNSSEIDILCKGAIAQREGRFDDAERAYLSIIASNRKNADALHLLGLLNYQRDRYIDAERYAREAVKLLPQRADYLKTLGRALFALERFPEAIDYFEMAVKINPRDARVINELALVYKMQGKLDLSAELFAKAIEIDPTMAEAHRNLALLLERLGRDGEALIALERAASLGDDGARHLLPSRRGETPKGPAGNYVRELFDGYAAKFEKHVSDSLGYKIPTLMHENVIDLCGIDRRFKMGIDLGCGSGMVGELFRGVVDVQVGIDIAPKMVAISREKRAYDILEVADVADYLARTDAKYDLITAGDVFIYIGEIDEIFRLVRERSLPDAIFSFSVEGCEGIEYRLNRSGRFSHSNEYIERLSKDNCFTIVRSIETAIRWEHGNPIMGRLYVLATP